MTSAAHDPISTRGSATGWLAVGTAGVGAVSGDLAGVLLLCLLAAFATMQAVAVLAPARSLGQIALLRSGVLPILLVAALLAHWGWTAATGGLLT